MNKLILYFNFENSFFEYHLPAINQREFQLDLGRYLPEYPCVIQFETIDKAFAEDKQKFTRLKTMMEEYRTTIEQLATHYIEIDKTGVNTFSR